MIWQIAVVRHDQAGRDWLEFSDPRECRKCSSGSGCGAALFSRMFAPSGAWVAMPGECGIPAGHRVRVGLDPRWLMLAALTTYLLPVIAFIAAAVVADRLSAGNDFAALISGAVCALVAAAAARSWLKPLGKPNLVLVELDQSLESDDNSGHFSRLTVREPVDF